MQMTAPAWPEQTVSRAASSVGVTARLHIQYIIVLLRRSRAIVDAGLCMRDGYLHASSQFILYISDLNRWSYAGWRGRLNLGRLSWAVAKFGQGLTAKCALPARAFIMMALTFELELPPGS